MAETPNKFIPISITSKAAEEVKKILSAKKVPGNYGLRIGIKGNGCLGPSRSLGFDLEKGGDMQFDQEGIKVLIRKVDVMYLAGLILDFYEDSDTRGFEFIEAASQQSQT